MRVQVVIGDSDLRRIPFVLPGANCTGSEARLIMCPGGGLGASTVQCGLENDIVSLACFSNLDEGALAPGCL